jgi:hypothetical protein
MTLAGLLGALLLWGAPVDAVATPRSQSADTFWTSEERPARLRVVSPTAQRRTGQGIFLIASVDLEQSCEYPGPVFEVRNGPAGSPRKFRARVWRKHGVACTPAVRQVEQPLHLPTDAPGPMRFESDGRTFDVEVSGPPPKNNFDARTSSRPCRFDGDCWVTELCVPRKNDPAGLGVCAEICGTSIDCVVGRCDHAPAIVGICSERAAGGDERDSSEWGQVCGRHGRAASCHWRTELNMWTRHDCRSDQECDPGLKCFHREATPAATGRCELLCSSARMACTGAHQCSVEGICEWLGE